MCAQHRTLHVHPVRFGPGLGIDVSYGLGRAQDGGIVHQDIHLPELALYLPKRAFHILAVAHVAADGKYAAQITLRAGHNRDAHALLKESFGDGPADTTRAARDESNFASPNSFSF